MLRWGFLLILPMLWATGCKGGLGERCSERETCKDGLACSSPSVGRSGESTGVCITGQTSACQKSDGCHVMGRCESQDGNCVAVSDANCGQSNECKAHGRCNVKDGVCVATRDADCEASELGKSGGLRHVKDGNCAAIIDDDCKSATDCVQGHLCAARGGNCVATSDADCAQSEWCRKWGFCALSDTGRCEPRTTEAKQPETKSAKFVQVSVDDGFACALRDDGEIECKGKNDHGQADPVAGPFAKVVSFHNGGYGLKHDGTVKHWGRFGWGLAVEGTFLDVSHYGSGECGVRSDGSIHCSSLGPAYAVLGARHADLKGKFDQISVGSRACALRVDGTAKCWGELEGRCETGPNSKPKPNAVPPPSVKFASLAIGCQISCGLARSGAVLCWGEPWATRAAPSGSFKQVAAGGWNACGIKIDGSLVCWGPDSDTSGVLQVPSGAFTQVAIHDKTACAVRQEGSVVCWGTGLVGNWTDLPHEQVPERHCAKWGTLITTGTHGTNYLGSLDVSSSDTLEGCELRRRIALSSGADKAGSCSCSKDQNGEDW